MAPLVKENICDADETNRELDFVAFALDSDAASRSDQPWFPDLRHVVSKNA